MKTMFVAPENAKKRFQKPNILRKKSKPPPKPSISVVPEAKLQLDKITLYKQCPSKNNQSVQKLILGHEESGIEDYQIDGNVETDRSLAVACDVLTNNHKEDAFEINTINVESFINNREMEQLVLQADVENDLSNKMKQGWCLDFINDTQEIIIEDIDGSHLGSLRLASTPPAHASHSTVTSSPEESHTSTVPTQNITLEYLNCTMNFKCDMQKCTKRFRSEEALNKHKSTHTKASKASNKDKPVIIECPVKKVSSSGEEEPCGVICSNKKDIINHLNECHDPEDAMFICAECGRRFYWAAGLRAHSRTHLRGGGAGGGGEPWACSWPGCGRAFRQPCRLREHMRAHTGDKPYPCRYPNCGWAFRTASKLLRHARRHTGERRHSCGECGRAFRRREHLRDHAVRHRANRLNTKYKHFCTHTACEKKFTNFEALRIHYEKVHKEVLVTSPLVGADAPREVAASPDRDRDRDHDHDHDPQPEQTFLVRFRAPALTGHTLAEVESIPPALQLSTSALKPEPVTELALPEVVTELTEAVTEMPEAVTEMSEAVTEIPEAVTEMTEVGSPRAARTHCTWPFPVHPPQVFEENANQEYVLEEDVQVEMCEGSESNIYTIRSDLFLHGNVLHNEDSEQMCGAVSVVGVSSPGEGAGGAGGAGLRGDGEGEGSLLDAHPTIDLMQEELMYTDAAVDESSFRVFLLSGDGEELG